MFVGKKLLNLGKGRIGGKGCGRLFGTPEWQDCVDIVIMNAMK